MDQTEVENDADVGAVTDPWVRGTLDSIEFVSGGDPDGREPGTYVTVRVTEKRGWGPGEVELRYLPQNIPSEET